MDSRLLPPIALVVLLSGCTRPPALSVLSAPGFRPESYRTATLDPRPGQLLIREGYHPMDPRGLQQEVAQVVATHGFGAAEAEGADLWVGVHLLGPGGPAAAPAEGRGRSREAGDAGRGAGGRKGAAAPGKAAPDRSAGRPEGRGMLAVIQVLDRASGQVLWQGEAVLGGPAKDGADPLQALLDALPRR